MAKITAEKIGQYTLVKLTYGHDMKAHGLMLEKMPNACLSSFQLLYSFINTKIRRRNIVADWIWAPIDVIRNATEQLEQLGVRIKLTDHTESYYRTPEKLAALRHEIDQWMLENLDADTVLDRVSMVGFEGISRIERQILDKKSKSL